MTKAKNIMSNLVTAASFLMLACVAQFGIIATIEQFTGWKAPRWVGWACWAAGSVSLIVAIIGSCGVSIPAWISWTLLGTDSVAA